MLSLKIKIKDIHHCKETDHPSCVCYSQNRPQTTHMVHTGDLVPAGIILVTPGLGLVNQGSPRSCHVLLFVSCYRHRANKFSKLINEDPLANLCHVSILLPS